MSPQRRDAEGRRQVGPSWESLVERQIREAMDDGAFDDLPYQGERLPLEDDSAAGDWAMAHRMLRSAGAAPPWIESDKEARRLLAELDALVERAPRDVRVSAPQGARRHGRDSSRRRTGRSRGSTRKRRPTVSIDDRWTRGRGGAARGGVRGPLTVDAGRGGSTSSPQPRVRDEVVVRPGPELRAAR